jgi:hypothetical protein
MIYNSDAFFPSSSKISPALTFPEGTIKTFGNLIIIIERRFV